MSDTASAERSPAWGSGEYDGRDLGGSVSVILVSTDVPGAGPALHRHTYDETFVIHRGEVEFTLAGTVAVHGAGDIVVAPPMVAHKFRNVGTDRLEMTDIHASPVIETEWLEERP